MTSITSNLSLSFTYPNSKKSFDIIGVKSPFMIPKQTHTQQFVSSLHFSIAQICYIWIWREIERDKVSFSPIEKMAHWKNGKSHDSAYQLSDIWPALLENLKGIIKKSCCFVYLDVFHNPLSILLYNLWHTVKVSPI